VTDLAVFSYETVLAAVSPLEAIERVRDGFVRYAAGEWAMPAKVYLDAPPNGDFRAMPARGADLAILKWVTSFPGNPEAGLPVVMGMICVSSAQDGRPLALVDVRAFLNDVVLFQVRQPFRADALSFLALFARLRGAPFPSGIGFIALAAVIALALLRAARTPAGFALGVAAAFFGFFAYNKQAFCNYYYFVVGALCVCVAASGAAEVRSPERVDPQVE
jgi:hypothetical protein